MQVYYDKEKKNYKVKGKTVNEILKELKIKSNTVIVVINNTVVTEDKKINKEDKIKILSVVSGG